MKVQWWAVIVMLAFDAAYLEHIAGLERLNLTLVIAALFMLPALLVLFLDPFWQGVGGMSEHSEACEYPGPLKFSLLHQAGGGPWCSFHTKIYANVLRGIAVGQTALALLAKFVGSDSFLATQIQRFLLVDSTLFLLFGPSPFSPLGMMATLAVWNHRGLVVSIMPYKLIFSTYVVYLACAVACPSLATGTTKGVACDQPINLGIAFSKDAFVVAAHHFALPLIVETSATMAIFRTS